MNKQGRVMKLAFGAAILASLVAMPYGAMARDEPLKIAVEGNFPPFNYLDASGALQGFDVEIANALCQAMDAQCTLVIHDWEEMIPGLLGEEYDAIVSSMSMSEERRAVASFTARYYDSPSIFITAKDSPLNAFAPEDLAGSTIGVTLATSQEAFAKSLYPNSAIKIFDTSPDLYEGLARGDVDLILEDKLAAYDWLTNTKTGQCCEFRGEDIKNATFFGDGAGIAIRKEDVDLQRSFDEALVKITEDGTYNMINAKYFPFSIR